MYVKQAILAVLASTSLTVLALQEQTSQSQGVHVARDELAARESGFLGHAPRALEMDERSIIEARRKSKTRTSSTPEKTSATSDTSDPVKTSEPADAPTNASPSSASSSDETTSTTTPPPDQPSSPSSSAAEDSPATPAGAEDSPASTKAAEDSPAATTAEADPEAAPSGSGTADTINAISDGLNNGPVGQAVYDGLMSTSTGTEGTAPTDAPVDPAGGTAIALDDAPADTALPEETSGADAGGAPAEDPATGSADPAAAGAPAAEEEDDPIDAFVDASVAAAVTDGPALVRRGGDHGRPRPIPMETTFVTSTTRAPAGY